MRATDPASPSNPVSPAGRIAIALALMFAWVLLSFVLPNIPLDGDAGNLAVRVADSGDWGQLTIFATVTIGVLISRPGLRARRRAVEGVALALAMMVALAGNALLNEGVVKPAFAVPRPNIVALVESRALGVSIQEPEQFYARGEKDVRSEHMRARLEKLQEPALSPLVREHWIDETGYSFPSGHSTAAMTFASLLIALGFAWGLHGWRQLFTNTIVPIWAVCVVYSRPLLEVHSGVDVTVGALAGYAWGLSAFAFVAWTANRFGDEKPEH